MRHALVSAVLYCMLGVSIAGADVIVDYTVDLGGNNTNPLNGLSARGTFSMTGNTLSILLENTSTGVPGGFAAADSLLVSLGLNLPGLDIASGDSAVIGAGSVGVGAWSARVAGDSVAEQWLWTNSFGGDFMQAYQHVISTSDGQGGGVVTGFAGQSGNVSGPFGGIAANPPLIGIPGAQPAVSDSILFELTLTGALSEPELMAVAQGSIVEYGSDVRYLGTPEPAALAMAVLGLVLLRRR